MIQIPAKITIFDKNELKMGYSICECYVLKLKNAFPQFARWFPSEIY